MLDRVEIVDCDYESGKPTRNPDGLCVWLPLGKILSIMSRGHHQGRIKTLVNGGGGGGGGGVCDVLRTGSRA